MRYDPFLRLELAGYCRPIQETRREVAWTEVLRSFSDLCTWGYEVRFYSGRTDIVCLTIYGRKCQKPKSRMQAVRKTIC